MANVNLYCMTKFSHLCSGLHTAAKIAINFLQLFTIFATVCKLGHNYLSFLLNCRLLFITSNSKIHSFMPVLSIRIVPDSFYLIIFFSEKFSTSIWRLPLAANVTLNGEFKLHVFCTQQKADSHWELLKIENEQIKTAQYNHYG